MIRRSLSVSAIAFAVLCLATPASAHEEINPSTVSTGRPIFLSLSAANERDADLVKITLAAPAGAPFGETTREPTGWTAQVSEETVTWSGGAVKPEKFESWGFEVENIDQPGALTYKVTLGFADGKTENAEVVVTATAGGAATATTVAEGPTTTVTVEPSTAAPSDQAAEGDDDSNGTAALVVGIIAGLVALAALATALRRRPAVPASSEASSPNETW